MLTCSLTDSADFEQTSTAGSDQGLGCLSDFQMLGANPVDQIHFLCFCKVSSILFILVYMFFECWAWDTRCSLGTLVARDVWSGSGLLAQVLQQSEYLV